MFNLHANGRNIVGCYMLRPFAHLVGCCWMLLLVVAQSLKPVKVFSRLYKTRTDIKQESLHNLPVVVSIPYTSTLKAFSVKNSAG